MKLTTILLMLGFLFTSKTPTKTVDSFHEFTIEALNSDEKIEFSEFKGKKILLVNVASKCGFTYQYEGLEKLYQEYKDDLVIVGFPCNQFMFQESGSEEKIAGFCQRNYGVSFPMTTKISVKGKKQHPIYQWLTSKELNGVGDYKVSWNFNKFLLDEEGNLLEHFSAKVKPYDERILKHLK